MAQAQAGPVRVSDDGEPQGHVSCILTAHLLLSMCFSLICLWFSLLVFKVPCALCFRVSKMLRSAPRKATNTGLLQAVLENVSLSVLGLKEPVFQQERHVQCFTSFCI